MLKLNHAVLKVRDLDRSVEFYRDLFGFSEAARAGEHMAFMRAPGSSNHHDLGFLALGTRATQPEESAIGLFHLAWEVPSIEELAATRKKLIEIGAITGESNHGATKSVYGLDPDGNEFEIMWMVPREEWGEFESQAPTLPLNIEAELRRYGRASSIATGS